MHGHKTVKTHRIAHQLCRIANPMSFGNVHRVFVIRSLVGKVGRRFNETARRIAVTVNPIERILRAGTHKRLIVLVKTETVTARHEHTIGKYKAKPFFAALHTFKSLFLAA